MDDNNTRKMYNEEQKREYIEYEIINAAGLKRYFERLSAIEEIYGKDIADMNTEELKTALVSMNIRSIVTRGHFISLLKGYIDWAIYSGKTNNENKIDNIKPEHIGSKYAVRTQMIQNPEQLRDILSASFAKGYFEQENRQTRDSLMVWLLYAGMTVAELRSLKKTDIDYGRKTVISPLDRANEYEVDDDMVTLWRKCCDIPNVEKAGTRHGKSAMYYRLVDNEFLFRMIAGRKADEKRQYTEQQLAMIIVKIFKMYFEETGEYIMVSPLNIRLSGVFYRLHRLETEGVEITPEVISESLKLKYRDRSDMLAKSRRYRIDYGNWKEAFGLN